MEEPNIPPRTSSKRTIKEVSEQTDSSSIEVLEAERHEVYKQLDKKRQKVKPKGSWSTGGYWDEEAEIAALAQKEHRLASKISIAKFPGSAAQWTETPEATNLLAKIKAEEVTEKLCRKQSTILSKTMDSKLSTFIQLFTSGPMGLGIKTGFSKRPATDQSNFRSALIKNYDSENPNKIQAKSVWCPILKQWVGAETESNASHIFAWKHGPEMMAAIFGDGMEKEMFSPLNGMLIALVVEEEIDKGFFVIVPDIPENPTAEQVKAWNASEPKEYKTMIIDWKHEKLDTEILSRCNKTWRSLHNERLQFRNNFRPRARYLYFLYCLQVLRLAWKQSSKKYYDGHVMKGEFGKKFWGTPGRYLPANMLRAFCAELGHDWEHLMDGAGEESKLIGSDDVLLALAAKHIKTDVQEVDEEDEEDDEDDENED